MTAKKVKDIRTLLQEHKRPEERVDICLRGDISSEINELDKQLVDLQQNATVNGGGFTGNPEAIKVAERIKKLEAEAKDATVSVLIRAVPKVRWRDLMAKHPGKDGEGADLAKIADDVMAESIIEPEMDPETKDKFIDALTQGQYEQLVLTVAGLNAGDGRTPKSVLASRALRSSDET